MFYFSHTSIRLTVGYCPLQEQTLSHGIIHLHDAIIRLKVSYRVMPHRMPLTHWCSSYYNICIISEKTSCFFFHCALTRSFSKKSCLKMQNAKRGLMKVTELCQRYHKIRNAGVARDIVKIENDGIARDIVKIGIAVIISQIPRSWIFMGKVGRLKGNRRNL